MRIDFDWDPTKAASNAAKHDVTFEAAMTIFRDRLAVSFYDKDSTDEERWVTRNIQWQSSGSCAHLGGGRRVARYGPHYFRATADPQRGAAISREPYAMKDEYDFSKAQRGRFYRPDAVLNPLVHLDPEVLAFLTARAEARGVTVSELVNALLKKDIELIEAAE
jgi:hypothetical protein